MNRYDALVERTKREFPRFQVRKRGSVWWMRALFWLLSSVLKKGAGDYSNFATTIFSTIYVPDSWDSWTDRQRYELLRHEKRHIRQAHVWPLGRWAWPLNHLLWAISYIFLPIPFFWTLRAYFERDGYTQTMLVLYELQGGLIPDKQMEQQAAFMVDVFAGPAYAWMWTKKAAYAWAMETMRRINAGYIKNDEDRIP